MSNHIYGSGTWGTIVKSGITYQRYRIMNDGKRKEFLGKTKKECVDKYKKFIADKEKEEKNKTLITLYEVGLLMLKNKKAQIKPTTYDGYYAEIEYLSKTKIGKEQIVTLTKSDIQEYINSLADTKTLGSIQKQKVVIKMIFDYAIDNGYVKTDITERIKNPNKANIKTPTRQPVFLTTEERHLIEKEAERVNQSGLGNCSGKIGEPFYGVAAKAIVFILHTGLRISELIPLVWNDVDFETARLSITKNAPDVRDYSGNGAKYKKIITTPKRESSIRTVPLDSTAIRILTELKSTQRNELVFCSKAGTMLNRRNVGKTLNRIVERCGIKQRPCIHDLRHTYASELIRNGADIKSVSIVLGHSDITTTLNIYVHKSDDDLDKLTDFLK